METLTLKEYEKIKDAYHKKVEEYSKHTPEELKTIWEESQKDKKKRIGGIYKKAFLDVLSKKLKEEQLANLPKIEEPTQESLENINPNNLTT